jgi:hypothetical protein
MAQATVTQSMQAKADALLAERTTWITGRRKSDSRAFYLFASSKPGHAYYCSVTGDACSCSGFFYRGVCSHSEAARRDTEQARAAAEQPARKSLGELHDAFLSDAF